MSSKVYKFKSGEIVVISCGEYSDYFIEGVFTVIKDFDAQEQAEIWAEEAGLKVKNGTIDLVKRDRRKSGYMKRLADHGFIEQMDYRELNTGYDNEVDLSFI